MIAPPPLFCDAGAGLGERLARHFHRPAVGVQQRRRVAHDSDMALPEHEVAAPQMRERVVERQRPAERGLLHVAVARRGDSRRRERGLRQAGAVDPLAGAPAPQIGRLEKTLGDGDEIGLARVDRREMLGVEEEAVAGDGEIAVEARDVDERAERQREARRPLDRRPGIGVGAQRGDPVGRRARRPERGRRQIADVAVARELDPAPVAALLVDDDRLAVERLGVERRLGSRARAAAARSARRRGTPRRRRSAPLRSCRARIRRRGRGAPG